MSRVFNFAADGDQADTDTRLTEAEVEITQDNVRLRKLVMHNPTAAIVFVKLWNDHADAVTVATDEPHKTCAINATTTFTFDFANEIFDRGLTMAATTESGAGASAPTAALDGYLIYGISE